MHRLMMSPEGDGGGTPAPAQTTTPPPASPVFQQPPRGEGQAPIQVHLTADEYNRLRGFERELHDFRRDQAVALEAAENARIKALADKGQVEEALNQTRQSWETKHAEATTKYAQLEQQVFNERRSAVMASAFAGVQFVGDTPEDQAATAAFVTRSLADEFETRRDATGNLVVQEKASGRPAAEVIRERLSKPPYTALIATSQRGGSGSDGSRPPATGQQPPPGSLESIAANFRQHQGQYPAMGLKARA